MENDMEVLVEELLDAIDEGRLNEDTISQFSYKHLYALYYMTSHMDNGKELFVKIKKYLERINISRLKKQKKIQVGFLANISSTWIGDDVYELFEKSERFEPYVIVLSNYNSQSDEMRMNEYYNNLQFFKQKNFRIIETMTSSGECFTWKEIGVKPQIFMWLTPWPLFRGDFILKNYSLDTLHTYIPYGFPGVDNVRGEFVNCDYNQLIHNFAWLKFELGKLDVEMAGKYAFVGKSNAVYTGYPKMDAFYKRNPDGDKHWNALIEKSGNKQAKKIIYAPHHTIYDEGTLLFSTFAQNYNSIFELAEKYQDETVWIFKPHPFLKYKTIKMGIFANEKEWNEYVGKWRNLKNADVMQEGDYADMFLESDGMINDSCSFLIEYLFTHKPLLFLRREGQAFAETVKEIPYIHYEVNGDDIKGIDSFIQDVILNEKDEKKDIREQFFREKFDYKYILGKSAAENIYEYFKAAFM